MEVRIQQARAGKEPASYRAVFPNKFTPKSAHAWCRMLGCLKNASFEHATIRINSISSLIPVGGGAGDDPLNLDAFVLIPARVENGRRIGPTRWKLYTKAFDLIASVRGQDRDVNCLNQGAMRMLVPLVQCQVLKSPSVCSIKLSDLVVWSSIAKSISASCLIFRRGWGSTMTNEKIIHVSRQLLIHSNSAH